VRVTKTIPVPPVSYRPSREDRLKLEQLRATFPNQQWKEVYDWVFGLECVRAEIRSRIGADLPLVDVLAEAQSS